MATSSEYILFVTEQLRNTGAVRYRKMFGDYTVYINEKPVLLVCDNTVYIKKLPELESLLKNAAVGVPYDGATERYILDIEDSELVEAVIATAEPLTPFPKPKKPRNTRTKGSK